MSEPYQVAVSVPQDLELTAEEQESLKASFKAGVLETLEAKGQAGTEVEIQLITGGGGNA